MIFVMNGGEIGDKVHFVWFTTEYCE